MSTTIEETDRQVQQAVQDELHWTPDLDEAGIGVAVERGVVTLSGDVHSYRQRLAAVAAAHRVRGVTTVADDLRVHPDGTGGTTDTDIAAHLEQALRWTADLPETVKVEVKDHLVTLSGTVMWDYQRAAARRIAERVTGVYGVQDRIVLKPRASVADVSKHITDALARNAALDAKKIAVSSSGSTVTLEGSVRSWAELTQAVKAAWASPNVTDVHNRLVVKS